MRIEPRRIVLALKENGLDAQVTATKLGIHKSTVYRWKRRAQTGWGLSSRGLKRKSTKPHKTKGNKLSPFDLGRAVKLRRETGWTAEKIVAKLNLRICSLTLHRRLKKLGFVRKYGYYRRPRFQNTKHMHAKNAKTVGYLQMDVKYITPELSGLPWTCFEYGIIDIFSRYKEAVILNHLDQDGSISALLEIIPKLPFKPIFLQTDNGLEFQARFKRHVEALGLKYHYIHKKTPNENALIERSFRTDEEEFFFRLEKQPEHYDQLRDLFAQYLYAYNHERPHLGIHLKTPIQVVKEQLKVANVC